jgi:hypothetical protein
VNYARSFRVVCSIHCASSQLGPDSMRSLGPLSSECSWRTLCYRCMYPSTNNDTKYKLIHLKSIDFVIPDTCLSTGTHALTRLDELAPCPNLNVCHVNSPKRPTPPPTFHAHIKDLQVTVSLYLQSETLWFLPPLDPSLARPIEVSLPSFFIFASDQTVLPPWRPGRGSGFFKPGHHPIIIPKSHVLLEAFMLLYVRNREKRIGSFSMAMISYIELYVDEDGFLEIEKVSEPLQTFYRELKKGGKPLRKWAEELIEAVGIGENYTTV